ncbi:hypothetical protein IPJ72_03940 [Candidatus Peregrinibacteria bacterium]|nr:MAG: hypothetical protein IPJ72_03940 [Candidatus Peregrinibacteria bacterium]
MEVARFVFANSDLELHGRARLECEIQAFRKRMPDLIKGFKAEVSVGQVSDIREAIECHLANVRNALDAKTVCHGETSEEVIVLKAEIQAWQEFLASLEEQGGIK